MCSFTAEFASLGQSWALKVELDQLERLCVLSKGFWVCFFFGGIGHLALKSRLAGAYFGCGGPKFAIRFEKTAIKPLLYVEVVLCASE